jgi:hypothetical protein
MGGKKSRFCASELRIYGGLRQTNCVAVGELYDRHSATVIAWALVKICERVPLTRIGSQLSRGVVKISPTGGIRAPAGTGAALSLGGAQALAAWARLIAPAVRPYNASESAGITPEGREVLPVGGRI